MVRNLSPTEKILELEALQKRYYELVKIRVENGGHKIPDLWQRWKKAQQSTKK